MAASEGRRLLTDGRLLSVLAITGVGVMSNGAVPVALPGIAGSMAVSDARVGLVMTAFFLPASVMMVLVGTLSDVYGRRRVVLPALAVFGLAGAGIFLVDSFAAILVLRGLQGVAFPAMTPLTTAIIGDLYEGPAGATAQGLRSSANGLAGIVGPAVAGVLAGIAWNYPFLLAALTLPVLAVVAVSLPETAGGGTDEGMGSHLRSIWGEFVDPNLRLLAVGAAVIYFTKFAILTYIPLFAVRAYGASTVAAGLLLSVRGLVRIFSAPLSGTAVDRTTRKRALAGTLAVVAAGTVLIPVLPDVLPGVPPVAVLGALVGVYSAGEALFNPVLNDTVVNIAAERRRGGVVTGISVFKNVASAASPAFFGAVLAVADFRELFVVAAAIPLAYAVALVVLFDDAAAAEREEAVAG